jgi:hypothetical protein
VLQLLVTGNVSSSLIPFTLKMEVIRSAEKLVVIRATRRHIREDGVLRIPVARMAVQSMS